MKQTPQQKTRARMDRAMGYAKKPLKAKFLGKNGYPGEADRAIADGLKPGRKYIITDASVSQSSSRVTVNGKSYNSVLFDVEVPALIEHFPNAWGYHSIKSVLARK